MMLAADPTFSDFNQFDPDIVNIAGQCGCGPTAATDSLFWLADKYNMPNLKKPKFQDVATELGADMNIVKDGGVGGVGFAKGKAKYLQDHPNPKGGQDRADYEGSAAWRRQSHRGFHKTREDQR